MRGAFLSARETLTRWSVADSFGLGNLSGIGSLVARNVEGKGIRVVYSGLPAAGQGGKAMNEVYDARNVIADTKWSTFNRNGLVRTR